MFIAFFFSSFLVLPAIIVALAAFKYHQHFIRDDFCWISTEHYVIWVFVGPSLFVLLVNSLILIVTLYASHKMFVDETEFIGLQRIARLTLLLMPIFGLTWVFGVLAVNKQLIIFQYVFTGINSFQGVFIFVCYCLLNNDVKREYQRVRRKSQYYSSRTNVISDNGFSTYIHPYPRRCLKNGLSTDDNLAAVQLTRFDVISPTYCTNDEDRKDCDSIADTLSKRIKKNYSVELLQLQQNERANYDGSDASECSLLASPDAQDVDTVKSSNFLDVVSASDGLSSTSELLDDFPYTNDTFQTAKNPIVLKSYQV